MEKPEPKASGKTEITLPCGRKAPCLILLLSLLQVIPGCAKAPEEKEIKRSNGTVQLVLEGIVLPSVEKKLVSPQTGRVLRVYAEKGHRVARNQALVEFSNFEAEIAYRDAVLNYEKAAIDRRSYSAPTPENRVLINNAKERLLSTYQLSKAGYASRAELKEAEDAYVTAADSARKMQHDSDKDRFAARKSEQQATKDVQRARLEVDKARHALMHARLTSPLNGHLAELNVSEGQTATSGEILGKVVNLDQVSLRGEFSPGIYRYLKPGMPVDISCVTVPPLKTKGAIREISPVADPESGRSSLHIPLKNEDYRLQPGTKCLITIDLPRDQANQLGLDFQKDKAYIKSKIRSRDLQ